MTTWAVPDASAAVRIVTCAADASTAEAVTSTNAPGVRPVIEISMGWPDTGGSGMRRTFDRGVAMTAAGVPVEPGPDASVVVGATEALGSVLA